MHTSNITVDDTEYTVHHNGDFSGDIVIQTEGKLQVFLPFELLKELVARYVCAIRIATLENADADDVLFRTHV